MTVGELIKILKKSADPNDIVSRQYLDKKETLQSEEINEVTVHQFNNDDGYVELW